MPTQTIDTSKQTILQNAGKDLGNFLKQEANKVLSPEQQAALQAQRISMNSQMDTKAQEDIKKHKMKVTAIIAGISIAVMAIALHVIYTHKKK